MKKLICLICLMVSHLFAADYYYAEVKTNNTIISSYGPVQVQEKADAGNNIVRVEITKAEYESNTVPQAKIDTAKAVALTEEADYDNWSNKKLRAVLRWMVKENNILRVALGLQPRTKAESEAGIKAEMK